MQSRRRDRVPGRIRAGRSRHLGDGRTRRGAIGAHFSWARRLTRRSVSHTHVVIARTADALIAVGGADNGSRLIVGPKEDRSSVVVPMEYELEGAHEIAGTGTLFPNENGKPELHMHLACGRSENAVTGCARAGVKTWHVIEVILQELVGTDARRAKDAKTGFELLEP